MSTTEPRSHGKLVTRTPAATRADSAGSKRNTGRSMTSARPSSRENGHADHQHQLEELRTLYSRMEAEAKAHSVVMQDSIKQNRQTWLVLKQENKELQAMMAARGGTALQAEGKNPVERQLEQLEMKVHELRRQHDRIMQEKKTALSKLQNCQDSLQHVSRGTGVAPGSGAPPGASMSTKEAREMRLFENRLDKAVLKANEAVSIRHTYEQVLEKLKQEQSAFDPCVKALEAAIKAKTQGHQQALAAQREANRQKEAAKHELSTFEERLTKERADRTARLEAQRSTVRTLSEASSALLARQMAASAAAGVASGGKLTGAGVALGLALREEAIEGVAPVGSTQEAVSALLAAVPGTKLASLADHLIAQQETYNSLKEMKQAAVHKVGQVNSQLESAKSALAELQSGGRSRTTQAMLDQAQAQLAQANAAVEAAKTAHDAVMKVYVEVRSGIEHLATMLAPLPLPPGHIPVPMSDDTLGDVLAQCQQRLVASVRFIETIPKAAALLENMMHNPEFSFTNIDAEDE